MRRYTVYLYQETAVHVRVVPAPIIRSANIYLQHLVFVTPLLLPAVIALKNWYSSLPEVNRPEIAVLKFLSPDGCTLNTHCNFILMNPCIVNYSVEIPKRCSFVTEFIIPKFFKGSACFERPTAHHQEL